MMSSTVSTADAANQFTAQLTNSMEQLEKIALLTIGRPMLESVLIAANE
jgi:hypothetical protein